MGEVEIKDMIFDLSVVLNKLADAKRDTQRHLQGCDDPDNLQARVDRLEDTMTDVAWEIDSVREGLDKLVDMLEEKKFKMDMDQLSHKVAKKWS
jgi:predicted site-specific integrase-resolvase